MPIMPRCLNTGANRVAGLTASALALNLKGGVRAFEAGAAVVNFVLSASEAHNQSNVRADTATSVRAYRDLMEWRDENAPAGRVNVAIATAFGCSMQGDVPEARVLALAAELAEAGPAEITLADTVGYGDPRQVERLFRRVAAEAKGIPVTAHFHDTRGMGLANVAAALAAGVRKFDAALAGLGGCPFAPGASGNIATEDTVYMLEAMGLSTGVDWDALMRLRAGFAEWLPGETLQGRLGVAGAARTFVPAA